MDEQRFDSITKALAAGQSRRAILRRLGGGLAGAIAASLARSEVEADHKGKDHGKPDEAGKPQGRCPDGFTNCRGKCVILDADENNCGACAVVCPAGWDCCNGVCTDPASFQDDPANCDACGITCAEGQACCGGVCLDTNADPINCGGCGVRCRVNETCNVGTCVCGDEGLVCQGGFTCCPGGDEDRCVCTTTAFTDPTTCEPPGLDQCPAGSTPCIGSTGFTCMACCPAGTTCDPETGTCLQ